MEKTISTIPLVPGVYLFFDAHGEILYIGKAKNLRRRVASYFQNRLHEPKIDALVHEHESVRYIATKNEIAALLLEAYLIRTYQPRFNALLRDGDPFIYIVFTEPHEKSGLPTIELVRHKPKEGRVFGPFLHKREVRQIHEFLMRTFRLKLCNKRMEHGCLDFHIGRCAGSCRSDFDRAGYLNRLELAHDVLVGDQARFLAHVQKQIDVLNHAHEFEKAREFYDISRHLEHLFEVLNTKFSEKHYLREVADLLIDDPQESDRITGLKALQKLLGLPEMPRTIDCFDISHFQGRHIVGSCIRFTDGRPDPAQFRRFTVKSLVRQDDYAALHEVVSRRYRDRENMPDVVLIDGGKGQLSAVLDIVGKKPCIALAKREETIFAPQFPEGIRLDLKDPMGRLLIALRNYAHHFAISFYKLKSVKALREKNSK